MNSKFTLKNFRVFDNEGATINIAPITVLTGCNSSGKSSVIKSILLLNGFLSNIKDAKDNSLKIELTSYKIDFSKLPNKLLGCFNKVQNNKSNDGTIIFRYTKHSLMLSEDLSVEMIFEADKDDKLNNGYLKSYSIIKEDGTIIFSSERKSDKETNNNNIHFSNNYRNFNAIKINFLIFLKSEYLMQNFIDNAQKMKLAQMEVIPDYTGLEEDFKRAACEMSNYLNVLISKMGNDIYIDYLNFLALKTEGGRSCKSFYEEHFNNIEDLDKSIKMQSLFYLPIFDLLEGVSKEDTLDIIEKLIATNDSNYKKQIQACLYQVIRDFMLDGSNTLFDYFIKKENEYLDGKVSHIGQKSLSVPTDNDIFCSDKMMSVIDYYPNLNNKKGLEEWKTKTMDFVELYETLATICGECNLSETLFNYDEAYKSVDSNMARVFSSYFQNLVEDMLIPDFVENINYVSSSRASVKGLYSLEEDNDFNKTIVDYYKIKMEYDKTDFKGNRYEPNSFMNKWVNEFGIGESISFDIEAEGLGIMFRLHKKNDDKGRLLSDEGYGITQLFSIILQIEIAIMQREIDKVTEKLEIEYLMNPPENDFLEKHFGKTIAIEEPEIHLHPSLQSKLAIMFLDAYKNHNIQFIIETHSEYLIRKFQTLVAKKDINANDLSLNFLYDADPEKRPSGVPHIKKINVTEDGRLDSAFGPGFLDEADNLAMDLLNIKIDQDGNA